MRIERGANFISGQTQLSIAGTARHEVTHAIKIALSQHPALGKGELENRIMQKVIVIDEILEHIVVHLERQHGTHRLHVAHLLATES